MFEDYQFDGVYIGIQPILTLYAKGQMQISSLSLLSHILVFMYIWKLNTMPIQHIRDDTRKLDDDKFLLSC